MERSDETRKPRRFTVRGMVFGLGGMIVGGLVGIAVQTAVASTGVLGPGLDELIDNQDTNLERITAKLGELEAAGDSEQARSLVTDLRHLVGQQREYATRTQEELRGARAEIARLKEEALDADRAVGGADLWLGPGESVTVGEAANVFGLERIQSGRVVIIASGDRMNLDLAQYVEFPSGDSVVRVYFKQANPRADGRVGFDVVRVEGDDET